MSHFRLLGPVEIVIGDAEVAFDRRQHRDLLVLLLLHANRTLTTARIVEEMWGTEPPATATAQLRNMISAVRRKLSHGAWQVAVLARRHGGYVLDVTSDHVDLAQFNALTTRAQMSSEPAVTARLLRAAVDLWRGQALAGVHAAYATNVRTALEERRVSALEELYQAELDLGLHTRLVPQLTAEAAAHPFRERLLRQLMVALYRSGRQVEALRAYREARRLLAKEHGLEPSQALRTLEFRVLRSDPTLDHIADPAGYPPASLELEVSVR
jgi:DNA-binding SARP family transcriptional activator